MTARQRLMLATSLLNIHNFEHI